MNHQRLRERLAHYRAGDSASTPTAAGSDSWPERVGHIRALVQARRRRLQPQADIATAAATDTGVEIAPGVRLLKTRYGDEGSAALPDPPSALPGDTVAWADSAPLLLFDTETTGLGSGAGQWVWMVGILVFDQGQWCLYQWWLTKPGSECLYLEAIGAALPAAGILLSYNGRSFDVPMLRTRHQLNGLANPFLDRPHLDLLHLVRRRYRGRWSDCRLATVERELLGRPRNNDLPGSMAPEAWRRYLRHGETGLVAQVLRHNRVDLESLAYLLRALSEPDSGSCGVP